MTIVGELTPVASSTAMAFDTLVSRGTDVSSDELLSDLSAINFIWPGGLVTLRALLANPELWPCRHIALRLPTVDGCRQYLSVAGLLHALPDVVTVESSQQSSNAGTWSAQTLLPLTAINTLHDLEQLAHQIGVRLEEMLGQGGTHDDSWRRQKSAIVSAIREMCHNVLEHAQSGGWIAAQRYRAKRTGEPFLEIAVADTGCGMRSSIARGHPTLAQVPEAEVLQTVVEQGLTRFGKNPTRGNGYAVLKAATRECDGSFYLRSGKGVLDHPRRGKLTTEEQAADWPGTYLTLRLACR